MKLRAACVVVGFLLLALSLAAQTANTASASAQVPPLIQFSNVATDEGGNTLSGVVSITFSLYASQQGGEPLWTETQTDIPLDPTGHYSVQLGITKPSGVPTTLFTLGEAHWVGVQISGQAEEPRVLLVSAPYALKAGDAATVGGLPPSAFVLASSQTESGAAALKTTGSATRQGVSAGTSTDVTTSGGTVGYLPLWDATSDIISSALFQTGSGSSAKIGIGITNPSTQLEVKGTGGFTGDTRIDINGLNKGSYTPAIRFGSGTNTGEAIASDRKGTVNVNGIDLYTDFTPRLSITNAGSVGIGTAAPTAQLNVLSQSWLDGLDAVGFNSVPGSGLNGTIGIFGTGGDGDPNSSAVSGGAGLQGYGGNAPAGSGGGGGDGVIGDGGSGDGGGGNGVGGLFAGNSTQGGIAGDGIIAFQGTGYGGNFFGDVNTNGSYLVDGAAELKIDHPLDPANKYLVHSSVESSEMKNIYDGNVITDGQGRAAVQLPEWFEVLNTDFRYQLTVIGQFAQAIVAQEIENNRFEIRTSVPNVKVSWQVTGVRQDAYAKAHPLVVEQQKEARLRGYYAHPELYGAPPEKQLEWARHPQMMKQIKEIQAKQRMRIRAAAQPAPAQTK